MPEGQIILINKPYQWTSFDVVRKVKSALNKTGASGQRSKGIKVGHAGTLDPLATGLLILCTESMTKKIQLIQDAEKEYTGSFYLGATTASFDLETAIQVQESVPEINEHQILSTAGNFIGKQMQTPPAHSAVKVDGKRSYTLARKGEEVELKAKEIEIRAFEITGIRLPLVDFRIVCTKGTYIRSIANDFGKRLACGAYLASLCRTRIGEYRLEQALEIQNFISQLPDLHQI